MNIAATLPRLLQMGFLARHAAQATRTIAPLPPTLRTMPRHAMMTLVDQRLQLRVLRGCLWVTRDGCPADRVLGAGDVFEQRPGAPVLVQALEETELLIACEGASAQDA